MDFLIAIQSANKELDEAMDISERIFDTKRNFQKEHEMASRTILDHVAQINNLQNRLTLEISLREEINLKHNILFEEINKIKGEKIELNNKYELLEKENLLLTAELARYHGAQVSIPIFQINTILNILSIAY